jgi:hypothetical protein
MVNVVADTAADQLSIPNHGMYVWSALNQKIPLTPYPIHFFFSKCLPYYRLVKDISHGLEQELKEPLLPQVNCTASFPSSSLA